MISPERIAVATENDNSDRIELAPFSVEELEQYLPFSNEYKRFNPIGPEDTEQTAEKIVREQEALEHYLTWGIYVVNTSPANFIGTIAVSEINAGTDEEPYWSKTMQESSYGNIRCRMARAWYRHPI